MNSPAPADFQARVRHQLRRDALDAAYKIIVDESWAALTMTAIAASVGVSRQTLYKEFSSKQQIGEALLIREGEEFIEGVTRYVGEHDDVNEVIEASIRYTLEQGAANPLLREILFNTGEGGGQTLLPLFSTRTRPLIELAAQNLRTHLAARDLGLDEEDVAATADALTRLTVSHLMHSQDDIETTVRRLTRLAQRNLGLI